MELNEKEYIASLSDESPSCAHSRVIIQPVDHPDGSWSDSWGCDACGKKFVPHPAQPLLRPDSIDLNAMTLRQVEQMASRLGSAASTIRSALALMGPTTAPAGSPTPVSQMSVGPIIHSAPHPGLDAGEVAERTRLLNQMRMNASSQGVDPGALSE